ncbi:hypothetical protein KIN20_019750 [Parelaphostrongylus tenuis]|uniref:Uncharacterized protein n=1 Tax=Parelaphostrongylus tenuis TaxID=148309 RepID=A0AAD5MS02_PARTN|nr:hypothetical protein KIN20_019750 [Parelaphostrongylus tenuis]
MASFSLVLTTSLLRGASHLFHYLRSPYSYPAILSQQQCSRSRMSALKCQSNMFLEARNLSVMGPMDTSQFSINRSPSDVETTSILLTFCPK